MNKKELTSAHILPRKKSKEILLSIVWVCVCVFLAAIIIAGISGNSSKRTIITENASEISVGWKDSAGNDITLPAKLPYPESGKYVLETILNDTNTDLAGQSIYFSAKYLNAKIFLNDIEIGSCICRPEGKINTIGKTFLLTQLPGSIEGGTLRIEASPLLGLESEYEISAPQIGDSGRIIYNLISTDLPIIGAIIAIFFFGIFLTLFGFKTNVTKNETFVETGAFAIAFALYSVSITDTIHLFIKNSFFIYAAEFILLAILPLPLLVLLYHVCPQKFKKILLIDVFAIFINICLQTFFQYFTQFEFRDTVFITHIIIGITLVLLIPILILSSRRSKEQLHLLISFSPILVGALWDLIRFYQPSAYQNAVGFQLGVLLFIFLQTIYLIHVYFESYQTTLEADVYRRLAYTDVLTGLKNRAAFEAKVAELSANSQTYSELWCICADVNCLKNVNDTLGHSAGDEIIRSAAAALCSIKDNSSELYRTGGDEFVMFLLNEPKEALNNKTACLITWLKDYNSKHNISLSLAVGYDRFNSESGDTIQSLISRADTIMYENKRKYKEMENGYGKTKSANSTSLVEK